MGRAALIYLGIVYAAGFVLGVIRGLVLTPRLGDFAAVLVEAPAMFVVIAMTGTVLARQGVTPSTGAGRLGMGALAGLGLVVLEITGGVILRGRAPLETITGCASPAGAVFLALAAFFTLWPALHGIARPAEAGPQRP